MTKKDHIKGGMLVQAGNGKDTVSIGRVAGLKKRFIRLRRRDTPDGERRYIPRSWVDGVSGHRVHLSGPPSNARKGWLTRAELNAWREGG